MATVFLPTNPSCALIVHHYPAVVHPRHRPQVGSNDPKWTRKSRDAFSFVVILNIARVLIYGLLY